MRKNVYCMNSIYVNLTYDYILYTLEKPCTRGFFWFWEMKKNAQNEGGYLGKFFLKIS